MQLRVTRTKRHGQTFEYAQLVESYRRKSDGMPTHRIIASLGALPPLEIENLRAAIQAGREGKKVALARPATKVALPSILANLRYLDAAVLLALWDEWNLTDLLNELLPLGSAAVAPASVVAALTLQRGLDPGSKLYATRWFPKTALPELLGVSPKAFNNTRVHRVLDELDAAGSALMAKLPRRYEQRDGAFVSLFLDTTDTWFVGQGPDLAAPGKTKEGLIQQKIGIALLCNERGYPLRWEVVSGASADCTIMTRMLRSVAGLSWLGQAPVVCDRAMGHTAQLVDMDQSGLRFLTALTVSEMGAYAQGLPWLALADLHPAPSDDPRQQEAVAKQAATAAQAAGMAVVDDDLLVMDLGVVEREVEATHGQAARVSEGSAQDALRLAREADEGVASGRYSSFAAASRALGMSKSLLSKYRQLRSLPEDVQREILEGKAEGCALAHLIQIAGQPETERQREGFGALQRATACRGLEPKVALSDPPAAEPRQAHCLKVRVAAYFNPLRFVEQRMRAQRHLREIADFVAQLNASLASPRSKRTQVSVAAVVDQKLRRYDLVEAFAIKISEQEVAGRRRYAVAVELDESEWALRRRYDGFTVLVAHPELPLAAVELCQLYRAKDVVEKDFQAIKSLIELRPVRHRTDGKVRAHVTICMLALLLERTLGHKLKGRYTADAALEVLEGCRLNRCAAGAESKAAHLLTQPTHEQRKILRTLGLERLGDQDEVGDRLTPR